MKKLFLFIAGFVSLFVVATNVFAAESIIYPIEELNNCINGKDCFIYCSQPQNYPACWSYSKYVLHAKVLGDATTSATQKPKFSFPIAELGNCTNANECKAYCEKLENRDACIAFSKKMGVNNGNQQTGKDDNKAKFLNDAKVFLGCNSATACSLFCSKDENKQKCKEFAQKEGLTKKPEITPGSIPTLFDITQIELGCDSSTTCKAVCSKQENLQKCREFAVKHNLISKPNITGFPKPSGFSSNDIHTDAITGQPIQNHPCTTSSECETYCKTHPGTCPGFPKPTGTFNTEVVVTSEPEHDLPQ